MKNSMNKIRPGLLLIAILTLSFGGTVLCQAATIYVSTYGATPNDGSDDTSAINSAITAAASGDIVSFSAGTYDLITPYDTSRFIKVSSKTNITLQGATTSGVPTTKLLRHVTVENMSDPPRTVYIIQGSDVTLKNFIIDNSPHLCTSGVITYKAADGKTLRVQIYSGLPMVSGTACYSANAWEQSYPNLKEVASLTTTTSPANWTIYDSPNRIMQLYNASGLSFIGDVSVNDRMSWHYGWNGSSQMEVGKTDGLTFENLIIRNAINMAILIGAATDITLESITMEPEGNQLPVGPRDGIHLSRCAGFVDANNLNINGVRLDGFVVHTPYAEITSKTDSTHFRILTEVTTFGQTIASGGELAIFSSAGNIFNRVISSATWVSDAGDPGSYYDIVTTAALPDWAVVGTAMTVDGLKPSSVSITNSSFKNLAGGAMVILTDDVTVDNVDCTKIMYPAIHIGDDPGTGSCGSDIIVRNSKFDHCGWIPSLTTGLPGIITLFNAHEVYTEPKLNTITIENNTFKNQLTSSTYPSINVYDTNIVTISDNLFENVYKGLKIDTATTSHYSISGNTVVIDNTNNSQTYTEVSGQFNDSGITGYNGSSTRWSGTAGKSPVDIYLPQVRHL